MNDAKIPAALRRPAGGGLGDDADEYPRSSGYAPLYPDEDRAVGGHLVASGPKAKVAYLYENDDTGKVTAGA